MRGRTKDQGPKDPRPAGTCPKRSQFCRSAFAGTRLEKCRYIHMHIYIYVHISPNISPYTYSQFLEMNKLRYIFFFFGFSLILWFVSCWLLVACLYSPLSASAASGYPHPSVKMVISIIPLGMSSFKGTKGMKQPGI